MIISIYLSLSHIQKLSSTSCQEHYYWICITAGIGGCLENKAYDLPWKLLPQFFKVQGRELTGGAFAARGL